MTTRVLVVDDLFGTYLQIARAVGSNCHVSFAEEPEDLQDLLSHEPPFGLAFVDMYYGPGKKTGLAALRLISEHSRNTKAVIHSDHREENRLLFLLASFYFFEPFSLISKIFSDEAIRAVVQAAEKAEKRPAVDEGNPYRPHPAPHEPLIPQLISRRKHVDIWRALTRFSRLSEVAQYSSYARSTVTAFSEEKVPVVREIERQFFGRDRDAPAEGKREPKLAPLHSFASIHRQFFNDPELDSLIKAP